MHKEKDLVYSLEEEEKNNYKNNKDTRLETKKKKIA